MNCKTQSSEDLCHLRKDLELEVSPRANLGTGHTSLILTESRNSLFSKKWRTRSVYLYVSLLSEHSQRLTAEAGASKCTQVLITLLFFPHAVCCFPSQRVNSPFKTKTIQFHWDLQRKSSSFPLGLQAASTFPVSHTSHQYITNKHNRKFQYPCRENYFK